MFIDEDNRSSRAFPSLVKCIMDYAIQYSCTTITASTDSTEGNPLNAMLIKRGFELSHITYRSN